MLLYYRRLVSLRAAKTLTRARTVEQASGRLKARATPDVQGFCSLPGCATHRDIGITVSSLEPGTLPDNARIRRCEQNPWETVQILANAETNSTVAPVDLARSIASTSQG